jgi:hypothetical protein
VNCSVHMFYKMIFSNKFGFILEYKSFLIQVYQTNLQDFFSDCFISTNFSKTKICSKNVGRESYLKSFMNAQTDPKCFLLNWKYFGGFFRVCKLIELSLGLLHPITCGRFTTWGQCHKTFFLPSWGYCKLECFMLTFFSLNC